MSNKEKPSMFEELDKLTPIGELIMEEEEHVEKESPRAQKLSSTTQDNKTWKKLPARTMQELEQAYREESNAFRQLLESTTIPEQTKILWSQVYDNILLDRKDAYTAWLDLYREVHGYPEKHAIHGDHINKYLERREKANAQLLKLAELAHTIKEKEEIGKLPNATNLYQRHKVAK